MHLILGIMPAMLPKGWLFIWQTCERNPYVCSAPSSVDSARWGREEEEGPAVFCPLKPLGRKKERRGRERERERERAPGVGAETEREREGKKSFYYIYRLSL